MSRPPKTDPARRRGAVGGLAWGGSVFKVDIYAYGRDYRVRLHHHAGEGNAPCDDSCEYEAYERTYTQPGQSPKQVRQEIALAAMMAVLRAPYGHVGFLDACGEQQALPGL